MTTWVKCKSSPANIPLWVNLSIARTMIWATDRKHTVIRFGPDDDETIEVAEKPEDLLKVAKGRAKK